MEMLIVQQKMIYQKHNLQIFDCHLQMFYEDPVICLIFVAGTVG